MNVKLFVVIAAVLLFFDSIYLYLTKDYFLNQVIQIQRFTIQPNYFSIALCYLFLTFGLYYFILLENRPVIDAFLLGLVVYGVYETTNMAILKKWKWETVAMDTTWGAVLFSLTTYYTRILMRFL
jgi:uncharacterized membrane protein